MRFEEVALSEAQEEARKIARIKLLRFPAPDANQIRKSCQQACTSVEEDFGGGSVDLEELVSYFERTSNIFVGEGITLDDPTGHKEWLPTRRAEIAWRFWERYESYLESVRELPEPVVRAVDVQTEKILERLEDPTRPAPWDRRGLVVGSIQSGKTGNFLGLVCKALDSGYKLIIILAGMHNSLRVQTQIRMEEVVLGYNTDSNLYFHRGNERTGVGLLRFDDLLVHAMTSRGEDGDFKIDRLKTSHMLGGDPFIVVVKKNSSILKNLLKWLVRRNGVDTDAGTRIIRKVPMLLIDDEADHASINTRSLEPGGSPEDFKPSTINMRIRELLGAFECSAYVGYTATPFANIFVDTDAQHDKLGSDIFPRSFIFALPAPSNYIGPAQVLGMDGDPDSGFEETKGLPLVRAADDSMEVFPPKYGKDFRPERLPESLRTAIRAFVLACAARAARGQKHVHNSMLVHVVRFVAVQKHLAELVQGELIHLQRRITHEGTTERSTIRNELRALWVNDFAPTTQKVSDKSCRPLTWEEVEEQLHLSTSKIVVKEINGTSADILDYETNRDEGVSVIAIGGDKLSRGLTLEGLTVSYYLRISKMYDTLLQMGRWFGYRDGYIDLCRLYTTQELVSWYRHIALADAELRHELDRMAAMNATPEEYGLRVRTHPDGLLVTAMNKARCSAIMRVSYAGTLAQTSSLHKESSSIEANEKAVAALLRSCGKPKAQSESFNETKIWTDIPANGVTEFLRRFKAPLGTTGFDTQRIAEFIEKQAKRNELAHWTIALIGVKGGKSHSIDGIGELRLSRRDPVRDQEGVKELSSTSYLLRNSNILSPRDQGIDFDGEFLTEDRLAHLLGKRIFAAGIEDERRLLSESLGESMPSLALELSVLRFMRARDAGKTRKDQEPPKTPTGASLRDLRPIGRGLLLLYPLDTLGVEGILGHAAIFGCAISFPTSNTAEPIEYQVNDVFQKARIAELESGEDAGELV
jgi:hypothetical protein